MASYQVTVIDAEGTETTVEVPDDTYILDEIEEDESLVFSKLKFEWDVNINSRTNKAITENSSDVLSFIKEEKGDYGPITYISNSFSIDNSKMIEVRNYGNDTNEGSSETIWVSTKSDSDYIEKIKRKNKKVLKVNTQTE